LSDYDDIIARLNSLANQRNVEGMARFGIASTNTLGIGLPALRELAKAHKRDHALALKLWDSRIHEARILATIIDDPKQVTPEQMDAWAADFDSWDVVDQACGNLFEKTPYADQKIREWAMRDEEFIRRAAFSLIAYVAVHHKKAANEALEAYYPIIKSGAADERNFVKKAVNWALRQIGKRNRALNASALALARQIAALDSKSARWIAADAIKELTSEKTQARLK
jgi:3-methyladenine DNA glycosylase AlkD